MYNSNAPPGNVRHLEAGDGIHEILGNGQVTDKVQGSVLVQQEYRDSQAGKAQVLSEESEKSDEPAQANKSLSSKWFPSNPNNPHMSKTAMSAKNLSHARGNRSGLLNDYQVNAGVQTQENCNATQTDRASASLSTMSYAKKQPTVFLLDSNELLTEDELYLGLTRIGKEYGRQPAHAGVPFTRGKSHSQLIGSQKLVQKARQNLIKSAVRR